MSTQTPYYIIASRLNAISNNESTNNVWEYKLNSGITLPPNTNVEVINAYINKQGITNESIEFTEDINESFQIGFTVPQTAMWQQKPERTPKDDRLISAALENPELIGLQVPEISVPLTNFYDCMIQHNPIQSDGMNLFSDYFTTDEIYSISEEGTNDYLSILVNGDQRARIGPSMPCILNDINRLLSSGLPFIYPVQALFCRKYMNVISITYEALTDKSNIVVSKGAAKLAEDLGTYDNNNLTGNGGLFFPNITEEKYRTCFGVAYINSLIGTKDDGDTYYRQSRVQKPNAAWEGAEPVEQLLNQIDDMQYQAGINTDLVCEEYRKHNADYSRDVVFNASQTSQTSYDFDRGSYSFYFGPCTQVYASDTIVNYPATKQEVLDISNFRYGPKEHGIRMNAGPITISSTGMTTTNGDLDNEITEDNFTGGIKYPYINTIPLSEYAERRDLTFPKPGQPAKFKDFGSPQIDYLRNGYSYDAYPMRCEIFANSLMPMTNTLGTEQNPFQPYIYQSRANEGISPVNLSTINEIQFLDRVVLSQSMISGLMSRGDNKAYVDRTLDITQDLGGGETQRSLRCGDVIIGTITFSDQSDAVKERLFPHRQFRGELDPSTVSTNQAYAATTINIPVMLDEITSEGTLAATIVKMTILSNLPLTGAVITNFIITYNKPNEINLANSQVYTFNNFKPFEAGAISDTALSITVLGENWEDQNPQYIPMFSAKGCFSELNGDSELDSISEDQDIDLGGGQSCKFNYFIDSMHDQANMDYLKAVGEDFAINQNYMSSGNDFTGKQEQRVCSHPYFNYNATVAGLREDYTRNKRILFHQRGNSKFGGIHPQRQFLNPDSDDGLTNSIQNFGQIPTCNYLYGSTRHCSLGSMRPPLDRQFKNGSQVVVSISLDVHNDPVPENNGLESLGDVLLNFDPENENNVLKIKAIEERASETVIEGIYPFTIADANVPQNKPTGTKNFVHMPNCSSALGEYEAYPYSTPATDMIDTGGTNAPLCLVQLQAVVEEYANNRNDYVLRPLTSEINIQIPKGVYSISGFIDIFNSQIKDIDENDNEQLSTLDNFKTVRRFDVLGGLAVSGGEVSLLNDFTEEIHNRTIYSTDEESEFVKNPLVIAIRVQDYNDLVRAWQSCGDALGVSAWLKAGEVQTNSKLTLSNELVFGGSYVWYNFRDLNYWCEFVDKYTDSMENLITSTEEDDIANYDTQFYFSKHRNLDDGVGSPFVYGCRSSLGIGDEGDTPVNSFANRSLNNQYKIDGNTEADLDKIRKYNPVKKGIYVGAPNFALSYDEDLNYFKLGDLHFAYRNPTMDLVGETSFPDNAIDQPAVLYRTISELITGDYKINGTDYNPPSYITEALQTPQDQISGVFIYNMAVNIANQEGDFINSSSSNVGRIFNDYFTTTQKAKAAWDNSFWRRLGFTYETFNTVNTNKLASYYLNPTSAIANTEDPQAIQMPFFRAINADRIESVKPRSRQALCGLLIDGSPFNDVSLGIDDNYLPGITTTAEFDIRAIPQVASSQGTLEGPNNTLVRQYNNGSISTVRSMSGGFVYFPMRLGNWDDFDIDINFTGQNIGCPGEGYIYAMPRPSFTNIIYKSGAVVPEASQLAYSRPFQYLNAPVAGYNPTSYYDSTFQQPVDGTNYPVEYHCNNYGYTRLSSTNFVQESLFNITNGIFRDKDFTLQGSMFLACQSTPILANSNDVYATTLPVLTNQGYFIITSDIIKAGDSIAQSEQMPILGTIPLSSLSSQDFITSFNSMPHTITQETIINSIKISILNPDLTNPTLEPDSSIILRIDLPAGNAPITLPQEDPRLEEEKNKLVGNV